MSSFIDTHVHIDFYDNPNELINTYERLKILTLFMTNLPEIFNKHYEHFNEFKCIRLALGYHPTLIDEYDFNKEEFLKGIDKTNYIGEVGLDFSNFSERQQEKQKEIFNFICKLSFEKRKIMSIHSRKAEKEVLSILKKNSVEFAIFHWYSGGLRLINDIIDRGYYFSVNYSMLKSKKGNEILRRIPLDRILMESDGPFTKYNKEAFVPNILENIYEEFNEFYGINNFKDRVFENFKKLLFAREGRKS